MGGARLQPASGDQDWLRACRSGQYYARFGIWNYVAKAKDVLYYVPMPIPSSRLIDRIACYITVVGDATARARLGIYMDDGTGNPGTLMVDGGVIDMSAGVGIKASVIAVQCPPPLVWLAYVQTFTAVSPLLSQAVTGEGAPVGLGADLGARYGGTVAQAYGALPAVAPAITALESASLVLGIRRV